MNLKFVIIYYKFHDFKICYNTTSFMNLKFVIIYGRFHEFIICDNILQVSWI